MIYFFQSVSGGPVKVGFTDNLDARWKQLEAHYGCPLALLATLPGGREEEAAIHERFGSIRFGRTEQFRPSPELMAFIGRPLLVGVNHDAVEAMSEVVATVTLKGSEEWKEWLERASEHCRTTVSAFIDLATAEYAKVRGFQEESPKR